MSRALFVKVISLGIYLSILSFLFMPASSKGVNLISNSQENRPIIIKSDRLEVDDELKLITFTGNVVATKGELKIKCKKNQDIHLQKYILQVERMIGYYLKTLM